MNEIKRTSAPSRVFVDSNDACDRRFVSTLLVGADSHGRLTDQPAGAAPRQPLFGDLSEKPLQNGRRSDSPVEGSERWSI